jgi:hypothetical protein
MYGADGTQWPWRKRESTSASNIIKIVDVVASITETKAGSWSRMTQVLETGVEKIAIAFGRLGNRREPLTTGVWELSGRARSQHVAVFGGLRWDSEKEPT